MRIFVLLEGDDDENLLHRDKPITDAAQQEEYNPSSRMSGRKQQTGPRNHQGPDSSGDEDAARSLSTTTARRLNQPLCCSCSHRPFLSYQCFIHYARINPDSSIRPMIIQRKCSFPRAEQSVIPSNALASSPIRHPTQERKKNLRCKDA